jgi:hypothetical protein
LTLTPTSTPTATPEPTPTLQSIEFELVPNWQAGDIYQFEKINTKSDFSLSFSEPISVTAPFTFTVLEADPDGYVLEWQYQEMNFGEFGELLFDELPTDTIDDIEAMLGLTAGLRVEYDTLPNGSIFSLRNTAEIKQFYNDFVDLIISMMADSSGEELPEGVFSELFDNLFTDELIEVYALGDPTNLHSLYGSTFNTAAPSKERKPVANPLVTTPLEALIESEVLEYDLAQDLVVIQGSLSWEPDQMAQMMVELMNQLFDQTMTPEEIEEIAALFENSTIEINFRAEAELSSELITLYEKTTRIELVPPIELQQEPMVQEETVLIRRLEE